MEKPKRHNLNIRAAIADEEEYLAVLIDCPGCKTDEFQVLLEHLGPLVRTLLDICAHQHIPIPTAADYSKEATIEGVKHAEAKELLRFDPHSVFKTRES